MFFSVKIFKGTELCFFASTSFTPLYNSGYMGNLTTAEQMWVKNENRNKENEGNKENVQRRND